MESADSSLSVLPKAIKFSRQKAYCNQIMLKSRFGAFVVVVLFVLIKQFQ